MMTDTSRAAFTLLWGLLAWLCTGATVAGEILPGAEPGTQIPTGLATELDDALTAQGWIRVEGADGSLIYRAPAAEARWASAPVESSRDEAPADYLRTLLEAYGWTAAPAEDGGVYYRPPGASGPPAAAPDVSEQGRTETGSLADRLRQTLEAQGWTAAPAEDGGVYYLSPGTSGPPVATPGASERGQAETGSLADRLRQTLEAQGWTAAPAEDGGVYYLPPGVSGQPAAAPDASQQVQTETGSLADRLRQTLEAQGWTAAPAEDGGVYYLPPTPRTGPSQEGVGTYQPSGEAVGGGVAADEQGLAPARAADAVAPPEQAQSPSETSPAPEPRGPEQRQPGGSPSSMNDATQPDYTYPPHWQPRGVPRFHMSDRAWQPVMRQHAVPPWRPSPWRAPPPGGAYPYR